MPSSCRLWCSQAHVRPLLATCSSPLEHLDIRNCSDQTVRGLGTVGFASLQHLVLTCAFGHRRWNFHSLDSALAGLPQLRSLHILGLRSPRPPDVLSCLSAASMPNLSLILFTDSFTSAGSFDSEVDSDEDADLLADYFGSPVCQDLVRRAPQPLHVVARVSWFASEAPYGCVVFFKHSTADAAVVACSLCDEANVALVMRSGTGTKIQERVQVQ
ncbi:uncharacterized protein LOC113206814 [Frankliniella occidentalis]|uniref:Uncharacterized protein LOC113206814 n=1 Tax=Frankliniella occidentalis TaxID=133901 RepID=A0A9C6XD40_FRAOC|nr:uncharacterized protein LOC113206814 [Frankliniella occidentalis]